MESSEEPLRWPWPLLPEGLFGIWNQVPGKLVPLQLMRHQPVFLQEKQLWLLFIPSLMQLGFSNPFVKAVGWVETADRKATAGPL